MPDFLPLLTPAEAAERLRISVTTLRRIVAKVEEFRGRRMTDFTDDELQLIVARRALGKFGPITTVRPKVAWKSVNDVAHLPLLSLDEVIARAVSMPKKHCGIYFLIRNGRVTYVGQTVNILTRISSHALAKRFDSWSWIPCAKEELMAMERRYIETLKPTRNKDPMTRKGRLKGRPANV